MKKTVRSFALIAAGVMLFSSGTGGMALAKTVSSDHAGNLSAGAVSVNMDLTSEKDDFGVIGKLSAGSTAVAVTGTNDLSRVFYSLPSVEEKVQDRIMTASAQAAAEAAEAAVFGYKNLGISTVDKLNVREEADRSSKPVGRMDDGAACEIIGYDGDWAQIESGEVEGYVLASYLATGKEATDIATDLATEMVTVHADALRVRSAADLGASILAKVDNGTQLEHPGDKDIDEPEDWVAVQLGTDTTGSVASEYVDIGKCLKTAKTLKEIYSTVVSGGGTNNVVSAGATTLTAFATQFVGNRYKWGGTSLTGGADCSGFVLSVFAQYGISLPHSSAGCGERRNHRRQART